MREKVSQKCIVVERLFTEDNLKQRESLQTTLSHF